MKKLLLTTACVMTTLTFLIAQSFTSERLRPIKWDRNTTIACNADHGGERYLIATRFTKDKATNVWRKEVKINDQIYYLRKRAGALNLTTKAGETLLATKKDGTKAYVQGKAYTRKFKNWMIDRTIQYYNDNDELMVVAKVHKNVIKMKQYQNGDQASEYLLSLCLEELIDMTKIRFATLAYIPWSPMSCN